MNIQYDQALALLKRRADSKDDLVAFTRLIDIPSVPIDALEDEWEVVNTPLADHHLLTLHALQGMVDGTLLYNPDTYQPVTRATPAGLFLVNSDRQTAHWGRGDGGGAVIKDNDPSLNSPSQIIPHPNKNKPTP